MNQVDQEFQHTEASTTALSIYRNFHAISLYSHIRGGFSGDLYEPSLENQENMFGEGIDPEEIEAMKEPIELSHESIRVLRKRPGWEPSLAWVELSLSWMLLYIEDLKGAERTTLDSLNHFLEVYPPEFCGVGVAKIQLADCYLRQGYVIQAYREYRAALEIFELSVGRQNPLYIIGFHKMANFLCQVGSYKEACDHYEFCLAEFTKLYGESNPTTKMVENNLGIALLKVNERARGLQYLHSSLIYRQNHYGDTHKFTRRAKVNHDAACLLSK
jgi:tetratricopeptide (TPR) repeat protein